MGGYADTVIVPLLRRGPKRTRRHDGTTEVPTTSLQHKFETPWFHRRMLSLATAAVLLRQSRLLRSLRTTKISGIFRHWEVGGVAEAAEKFDLSRTTRTTANGA